MEHSNTIRAGKAERVVSIDEQPGKARSDKILDPGARLPRRRHGDGGEQLLDPDGAAALILMCAPPRPSSRGLMPRARILGHATFADRPNLFPTAPIGSVHKLMERTGLSISDIDLWEVNEAFAVVAMAAMHDLGLPHDIVNVNGGACALGHPIGASGARSWSPSSALEVRTAEPRRSVARLQFYATRPRNNATGVTEPTNILNFDGNSGTDPHTA